MSEARNQILSKIRTTRTSAYAVKNTLGESGERLKDHPSNLIPERGNKPPAERASQFIEEATRVNATVAEVGSEADVPQEIARYLADNNLPSRIKQAPSLSHLDWSNTMLEVAKGQADKADEVSVTCAYSGVAETGTLVTYSGTENPTTLNFLPPVHIAVLKKSDLVGSYEDVWARLRTTISDKDHIDNLIPRNVNFITGPSRTGDIQQTLLLGIHGPQRLHIVLIDDEAST